MHTALNYVFLNHSLKLLHAYLKTSKKYCVLNRLLTYECKITIILIKESKNLKLLINERLLENCKTPSSNKTTK